MAYIIGGIVAIIVFVSAGLSINKYQSNSVERNTVGEEEYLTEEDRLKDEINAANEFVPKYKPGETPRITPRTTARPGQTQTPTQTTQQTTQTGTDQTAPVLSSIAVSSITSTGAVVTWTTNEPADSQVEYGLSSSYGARSALDSNKVTYHQVSLSNLSADRTYSFRVWSRDAAGNLTLSGNQTFDTTLASAGLPDIEDIEVSNITTDSARIRWTTDIAADTQVRYGKTTSYGDTSDLNSSKSTSHSVTLDDLDPDTLYHYRVISKTSSSNSRTSSDKTFRTLAQSSSDTAGPTISNIAVSPITQTSATVTWNTNENADSAVEYGLTSSYGSIMSKTPRVSTHSVTISGLEAGKTYHYRVQSRDAANNLSISTDRTFVTPSAADTTAPVMSNINTTNGTDWITLTWTTSELADTKVLYSAAGKDGQEFYDSERVTSHTVQLTGLDPETAYDLEAYSTDAANNRSTSYSATVSTGAAPTPTPQP